MYSNAENKKVRRRFNQTGELRNYINCWKTKKDGYGQLPFDGNMVCQSLLLDLYYTYMTKEDYF